jgi:hypothetical protein
VTKYNPDKINLAFDVVGNILDQATRLIDDQHEAIGALLEFCASTIPDTEAPRDLVDKIKVCVTRRDMFEAGLDAALAAFD